MCFPGLSLFKDNSNVCCTVCVLQVMSSIIIFMGFHLVDKVKSVVKNVLFIFRPQSCAQHDRMLVASLES